MNVSRPLGSVLSHLTRPSQSGEGKGSIIKIPSEVFPVGTVLLGGRVGEVGSHSLTRCCNYWRWPGPWWQGSAESTGMGWGRWHLCASHWIPPLAGSITALGGYGLTFKHRSNTNILWVSERNNTFLHSLWPTHHWDWIQTALSFPPIKH